jgi:hypothetical protein
MKRVSASEPNSGINLLRVQFSDAVSTETLQVLHTAGLEGDLPSELRELVQAVGGERISSVHRLSPQEIADDTYGFAREFKLQVQVERDAEQAIDLLKRSPLVKNARPMLFRRSF